MNALRMHTPCFTIQNLKIVEGTLSDFSRYIENCPRPGGVGSKYYVTQNKRETDEGGTVDTWCIAKYAGREIVVRFFDSEIEADLQLEEWHINDILSNDDLVIYLEKGDAQAGLDQILEEIEDDKAE
jgi:hypothetical protein